MSISTDEPGILIVDDNEANLVAFMATLENLGRRLVTASSGHAALGCLLHEDFALILLDVRMPDMDGYETANLIRGRARSRDVPIIFISAIDRDESSVLRGYKLGGVDYVFKPVQPAVLCAKAKVFLALHDRTAEVHANAEALRRAEREVFEKELAAQQRNLDALAMEQANYRLAAADRNKDEFIAILAHELRNPLASLRVSADVIALQPDLPLSPRVARVIDRQIRHLTRLVDDLLDVSRIHAGKLEVRRERVAFPAVVDDAISASGPLLQERGHVLVVEGTTDSPEVMGDPTRLIQIVANLIANAAKFTPEGGRIEVRTTVEDALVVLSVVDSGRGIPAHLIDTIFDMYVQERNGADGGGGLGLGLALVRRLVDLHGGVITASSPGPGLGSRFEVRLPRAAPSSMRTTARMLPLRPSSPSNCTRVAVIDDDDDLREGLAALLLDCGYEVETAADGPSGLALLRAHPPDVALIDVGLPELDGYEVARQFRAEAANADVRLVAMTGHGRDSDRARALAAGFDAHILKPASVETILRAVETR